MKERKKLFVDRIVQLALIRRALLYWCFSIVTSTFMYVCWQFLAGQPPLFSENFDNRTFVFLITVSASVVTLPLVVIDIVRLSNRFVGPMIRLREKMHQLSDGKIPEAIHFRDSDYWHEFAEDFNAVVAKVAEVAPTSNVTRDSGDELPVEVA